MNDLRVKHYEEQESGRRFRFDRPVIARVDGRRFSSWTRGLQRPHDARLGRLMVDTTAHLMRETGACVGYTQSDEITLIWSLRDGMSPPFGFRVAKMTSVVASITTAFFNASVPSVLPERVGRPAEFDCRVWSVPDLTEAANTLIWREMDAERNAIGAAARTTHSHNELLGVPSARRLEMHIARGGVWEELPAGFRQGSYLLAQRTMRKFSEEEIPSLPDQHEARRNPDLVVQRRDIRVATIAPLRKQANPLGALFGGHHG
jgi:tRNA(His) 5'-end guanylyltransferase